MQDGGFGEDFRMPELRVPRIGGGIVRGVVLIILALVIVFTGFYTIGPEEIGVVLRFGAFTRTTGPGLHFKIPFWVEMVEKVPVQRQLKEEFGFRTLSAGVRSQYATRGYEGESHMLTGDLNGAVVEWVVQFRVVDAYKYLFRVRNVRSTFRSMSEAVMRRVVGDRTVNEVLTVGRQEIADLVEQDLQDLCDQYETGIKVEQVVLQDVNPPDPVKRASGEAQQTIQQAEGYALDRVNRARGDSARFVELFEAYQQAPEVTRKRIYLETMREVLPRVASKTVVDEELGGVLPLLNLETGGRRSSGSDQ